MDEYLEHSDSDSGESWTLLETNPAQEFAETIIESPTPDNHDDDTDGISIISDSDHENFYPYQIKSENFSKGHNQRETQQYISFDRIPPNLNTDKSLEPDNVFTGDNNKNKIYVHKRNKRLSTVLNIIVLGSVITAAGVAIGHMWGAKNDCLTHVSPSVNKILSNLYKLQEENAYLRNKLKELSQYQIQQKLPIKLNKCKKVFEEPLNKNNVNRFTKCVDDSNKLVSNLASSPSYEREFVTDLNKLENIYKENKYWLDEEIKSRLKVERGMWNNNINHSAKPNNIDKGNPVIDKSDTEFILINKFAGHALPNSLADPLIRVTYADSLKNEPFSKKLHKRYSETTNENYTIKLKNKKRENDERKVNLKQIISDEEVMKDDRYIGNKNKKEKKKINRHKSFKKQKRHNKYEQWEMNGGLILDYDDFSISSQEDHTPTLSENKSTTVDATIDDNAHTETSKSSNNCKNKKENLKQSWFDKRAELRQVARQKLEQEMFGEVAPNSARWYFRRMKKRVHCRSKDNNTFRKLNDKRDMNYKTKH